MCAANQSAAILCSTNKSPDWRYDLPGQRKLLANIWCAVYVSVAFSPTGFPPVHMRAFDHELGRRKDRCGIDVVGGIDKAKVQGHGSSQVAKTPNQTRQPEDDVIASFCVAFNRSGRIQYPKHSQGFSPALAGCFLSRSCHNLCLSMLNRTRSTRLLT